MPGSGMVEIPIAGAIALHWISLRDQSFRLPTVQAGRKMESLGRTGSTASLFVIPPGMLLFVSDNLSMRECSDERHPADGVANKCRKQKTERDVVP